jgi:flagellar motor component MotA
MASEMAKAVALDVVEAVRNGEKPNVYQSQLKHGYSERSAKSMKVKETKTYQEILEPFEKVLDQTRRKAIKHMTDRKLERSSARDLAYISDVMTKNHNLITGNPTEINEQVMVLPSEILEKNKLKE